MLTGCFSQANLRAFNYFEFKFLLDACWHNTCSSLGNFKKIGFPGWPDPNLDSVSGFGASIQKGGLHQPPFFHSWCPLVPQLRPALNTRESHRNAVKPKSWI
jgi:hypothetical protein